MLAKPASTSRRYTDFRMRRFSKSQNSIEIITAKFPAGCNNLLVHITNAEREVVTYTQIWTRIRCTWNAFSAMGLFLTSKIMHESIVLSSGCDSVSKVCTFSSFFACSGPCCRDPEFVIFTRTLRLQIQFQFSFWIVSPVLCLSHPLSQGRLQVQAGVDGFGTSSLARASLTDIWAG